MRVKQESADMSVETLKMGYAGYYVQFLFSPFRLLKYFQLDYHLYTQVVAFKHDRKSGIENADCKTNKKALFIADKCDMM